MKEFFYAAFKNRLKVFGGSMKEFFYAAFKNPLKVFWGSMKEFFYAAFVNPLKVFGESMKEFFYPAFENPLKVFWGSLLLLVSLHPFFDNLPATWYCYNTQLMCKILILIVVFLSSTLTFGCLLSEIFFLKANSSKRIKKLLKNTKELRIFASGSETDRTLLEDALSDLDYKKSLKIKILVRSDGKNERDKKLKEAEEDWIEKISKLTGVEIKSYDFSPALRGMIFDYKTAILGWYHHNDEGTKREETPSVIYKARNEQAKEVIKFSIRTFDYIFKKHAKKISK